jgi:hypothetical protein
MRNAQWQCHEQRTHLWLLLQLHQVLLLAVVP